MKNIFKVFGIVAIAAIIGFSMAACGGGDDTPPISAFAGTWNASNGRSIYISGNYFEYSVIEKVYYGNFSVSGSTITFDASKKETWSGIGKKSGKFTLSQEEGTLTLSGHTWDINVDGVYTRYEYDSGDKVIKKMTFSENSGDWKEPGHEDYSRWYYNYQDTSNLFDISPMYANNKAYILTCSFSSDIDIDDFNLHFTEEGDDDNGIWQYKTISDWTWITWDIKKDTRYNNTIFLIPNANATGTKPAKTYLQFLNKNRNVSTPATVSFYQFSLEQVDIVDINLNVTADGDASSTTTQLTLALAKTVPGLSADDITLNGIKDIAKDTLSGSGLTYTLPISGFTKGGALAVGVEKADYVFKNWIKQVTIYYTKAGSGGDSDTFNNLDDFKNWLNKKSNNSKSNPFKVKLNFPNLSGLLDFLKGALGKFLNLDFSGSSFTGIGANAFKGLTNLTGITLPSGLKSIGAGAFSGCSNLTSVTFKGAISAGSFNSSAFAGLGDLRNKYLAGGAGTYTRDSDGTTWTKEGSIGGTFDSLDGLKDWLNKQNTNSKGNPFNIKLRLPSLSGLLDFLKGLSGKFFNLDLSGMNLSGGIGADAFKGLANLIGITLPNGITGGIGANAFNGCTNLISITIPSGINGIGANAFTGCSNLVSVTFDGTIGSGSFDSSAFSGLGDLRDKYLAGGAGTYTRDSGGTTWTKQDDSDGGGGGGDTAVTFSGVTANGSSTQTTTQLTLTFSQAITGLSASDITLSGVSGVSKGTLSGSGPTYTLPISGFTSGGTLSVAVSKTGYTISGSPKTATIYCSPTGPFPETGTLAQKLAWLAENAVNGTTYTITVTADESVPKTTFTSGKFSNVTILLKGDTTMRTISPSSTGGLFTIGTGVTLILDNNITLRGLSNNNTRLVGVGGTLEMREGSRITGNSNSSPYYDCGGVYVTGVFNMLGGEISNNTVYSGSEQTSGGGVCVDGGTFTMSGGKISGNTLTSTGSNSGYTSLGAGVCVWAGTFNMSGGEISGNTASSNVNSYGGGVFIANGASFSKTGGTIYGYTSGDSNSNTVKVSGSVKNGNGHAAFRASGNRYRDTTAGTGVNLSTSSTTNWN